MTHHNTSHRPVSRRRSRVGAFALTLGVLLTAACGSGDDKSAVDKELERQIKATCDCLASGDPLAMLECESRHIQTLEAMKDPTHAKRLKAGVDACRPPKADDKAK